MAPLPPWLSLRALRMATGLVLFAYVTTHLANHALGLFGLGAMEAGRSIFIAFWRAPAPAAALYGSLCAHLALALWALFQRRHFRMPWPEAMQLLLGLAIPIFLVTHVIGTHFASRLYGVTDSYTRMMLVYRARPDLGMRQVLVLLLAWTHGCIGLQFWLRARRPQSGASTVLAALALLLPLLALLGFLEATRETAELARRPGWVEATVAAVHELDAASRLALSRINDAILLGYGLAIGLVVAAGALRNFHERRYRSFAVTYPDGRVVVAPRGYSVLEASRFGAIAHASVCGGRGRCSTCRVRVTRGLKDLPGPGAAEQAVLRKLGAQTDVRLACQLRPATDLAVAPLLRPLQARGDLAQEDFATRELNVCVLFADLRNFTRLSERKLPYDTVFFLNRYFEAMSRAVEDAGGIANQFTGDGVMALFGIECGIARGCGDAIAAANAMLAALATMSSELAAELDGPLRMGIGIHAGPAVIGRMGRGPAKYLTAVGDTVHVASRLQDLTRTYGCPLIISEPAARLAGLDVRRLERDELAVRNRREPIAICLVREAAQVAHSGA
jgi:adenylate cyclase